MLSQSLKTVAAFLRTGSHTDHCQSIAMGFGVPAVVDLVLISNSLMMLIVGNLAYAPAMVPPGELVHTWPAARRCRCCLLRAPPAAPRDR